MTTAGVDLKNFPNLYKWAQRINERPAVKKGLAVPTESKIINPMYEKRLKEEDGFADKEKELQDLRDKAKEQYKYVDARVLYVIVCANLIIATSILLLEERRIDEARTEVVIVVLMS